MFDDNPSAALARDLVLGFERECDPFRHRVRGASIWTALRFPVSERLRVVLGDLTPRGAAPGPSPGKVSALGAMLRERRQLSALGSGKRRCDILALTTHNRLRDATARGYRNVYYDYFDPALEKMLQLYLDSRGEREPVHPEAAEVSARALWPEIARMRAGGSGGGEVAGALRADLKAFLEREGVSGRAAGPHGSVGA